MGMTLSLGDLRSRAVRKAVAGSTGIRVFKPSSHGFVQSDDGGGIIGSVINAVVRFTGWVLGKLFSFIARFVAWSLGYLWGLFCSAVSYIWTFTWNESDEDINKSLQSAWEAFGGVLGGAAGTTLGNLVVLGGSATLFFFNEALALYVLRNVGEEAFEEICSAASSVVTAAIPLASNYLFKKAYMKIRSAAGLNPDQFYLTDAQIDAQIKPRVESGELTQAEGDALKNKNKAGRESLKAERKPWSFANQWEEYVEKVQKDNPFWGNFLENLFEETFEAISSTGYVAFGSIDSYVAEHRLGVQASGQEEITTTVELTLDRSLDVTPTTDGTAPA